MDRKVRKSEYVLYEMSPREFREKLGIPEDVLQVHVPLGSGKVEITCIPKKEKE